VTTTAKWILEQALRLPDHSASLESSPATRTFGTRKHTFARCERSSASDEDQGGSEREQAR
jgi:hypothetical protein